MKLRERTGSLSKPGGWRILLVDDHEGCLSSQKASIMYGGKTEVVCTVNNFAEALDLIRSERFDLIALDLQMEVPARDGVTFLTRLRQEGHAGPIVMLTSETSYKWFAKSIMAGADDFWIKTDRPRLHELVEQLLEPSSRTIHAQLERILILCDLPERQQKKISGRWTEKSPRVDNHFLFLSAKDKTWVKIPLF